MKYWDDHVLGGLERFSGVLERRDAIVNYVAVRCCDWIE